MRDIIKFYSQIKKYLTIWKANNVPYLSLNLIIVISLVELTKYCRPYPKIEMLIKHNNV